MTGPDLKLTDAERDQILQQRERKQREEYVMRGIFVAADYLTSLGNQCAGGDGMGVNPATGLAYGEDYYSKSALLRRYAADLQADWRKRV